MERNIEHTGIDNFSSSSNTSGSDVSADSYGRLKYELSHSLSQKDVDSLCARFNFSAREADDVKNECNPQVALLRYLEAKGQVAKEDVSTLANVLQAAGLNKAAQLAVTYQLEISKEKLFPVESQANGNEDELKRDMEELSRFLQDAGLEGQYPCKLTLKMMRLVRCHDGIEEDSRACARKELPFTFIRSLTSLDRRVALKEQFNIPHSVRDFIYALLLCSDNLLRQHILEKMSACHLAVPVIIPAPDAGNPTLLLWSLRRITKKWKKDTDYMVLEKNMVKEPLFTVAFLRIGNLPISKSVILNNLFGRVQSNATVCYFISQREDYEEDTTFSKGTVEGHWYIPSGKNSIMKEMTLVLNVRGNSMTCKDQVTLVSRIADLVFVFKKYDEDKSSKIKALDLQLMTTKYFVVSLKQATCARRCMLEKFTKTDNYLEYVLDNENILLSKTLAELIQETCSHANSSNYKSIESWTKYCKSSDVQIDIDEDDPVCANALAIAKVALHDKDVLTVEKVRTQFFPLWNLWRQWITADQKRITQASGLSIAAQKSDITTEKHEIRCKQFKRKLSSEMKPFFSVLKYVTLDAKKTEELQYFMTYFQIQLDSIIEKECKPLVIEINDLERSYKDSLILLANAELEAEEREVLIAKNEILKSKLQHLRTKYSSPRIGFEHFMRELGQLYEANDDNEKEEFLATQQIAAIAARLLIEGYPLEILDGESSYIPLTWIKSVLNILNIILKEKNGEEPRIFVLSIVGVQSSGKSTLLNCMFGVRFPVRSGRCTRGLYLHILELEERHKKLLGFQYVFLIDTEGLQSPHRASANDYKFDNSLATLAMSIVDLSILNIPLEVMGPEMIGILQIAAHALIRMKKVNLVSACHIVHQRVSDVSAAGENKHAMNAIEEALDKATFAAAEDEGVSDTITKFSDIFRFTETEQTYLPCLWLGNMCPPNHDYSDKLSFLKNKVILQGSTKLGKITPQFTLTKFIHRLNDVWNALKTEEFVFNFQNSFNALSYNRFKVEHNKWIADMRIAMVKWEIENKRNRVNEKKTYLKKLQAEIDDQILQAFEKIKEYVKNHSEEEEVKRHEISFQNITSHIAIEIQQSIRDNLETFLTAEKGKANLPNVIKESQILLRQKAKSKALQTVRENFQEERKINEEEVSQMFDSFWKELSDTLEPTFNVFKVPKEHIITTLEDSLVSVMRGTKYNRIFKQQCEKDGGIVERQADKNDSDQNKARQSEEEDNSASKKEAINKVIKQIVNEELKTTVSNYPNEAFDNNFIQSIFPSMLSKLDGYINSSRTFAVKKLIHCCRVLANVAIKKQKEYEEKYSFKEVMKEEKQRLKGDFLSFFDRTLQTERVADRVYCEILSSIKEHTLDKLNVDLLLKLKETDTFIDRKKAIGRIFYELCNGEDEIRYLRFLRNQEEYIQQWLKIEIICETEHEREWIESTARDKLHRIVEGLVTTIHNVKEECEKSLTRETLKDDQRQHDEEFIPFDEWGKKFLYHAKTIKLHIDLRGVAFDTIYYTSFTEILSTKVKAKMEDDCLKDLQIVGFKTGGELLSKMHKYPPDEIFKQIKGCSEVCPFCKVGCDVEIGHTEHESAFHYPIGLVGFKNKDSKELPIDVCSSLVASDLQYRFKSDEKYRPYKEYKSDFENWTISPNTDEELNDHWKWVFANFSKFFAEIREAKEPTLPHNWKEITKTSALLCIQRQYCLEERPQRVISST